MKLFFINLIVLFFTILSINMANALGDINVSIDTSKLVELPVDSLNFKAEIQYARDKYLQWKERVDMTLVLLSEFKKIKGINIVKYTPKQYAINFSLRRGQANTLKYQCSSYGNDEILLNNKLKELRIFSKKIIKSSLDIDFLDKTTAKNFKLFFSKKGQCQKLTKELDNYLKIIELLEKKASLIQ